MRLFHFSEDPGIVLFEPRPVRMPAPRPAGQEWLNGPLVWAISEAYDFLYLFPRECPRIVLWATAETTLVDRKRWLGEAKVTAFMEQAWLERLSRTGIFRYDLPLAWFYNLGDAGMWVSKCAVTPRNVERLTDLPARLDERGVQVRALERLSPLKAAWKSTVGLSGIRLRNAAGWEG